MVDATGYVVASGAGNTWDMEPGRPAVFKLLSQDTGGSIAVFEETVPAGAGTPLHRHRNSDEVLLVQRGEFSFRLGERQMRVSPGAWVFIPRGSIHGWRNIGAEEGQLANIFAPATDAAAFEEMRLQGRPVPEIDPAVRDEIFQRNGYEFITWDWS